MLCCTFYFSKFQILGEESNSNISMELQCCSVEACGDGILWHNKVYKCLTRIENKKGKKERVTVSRFTCLSMLFMYVVCLSTSTVHGPNYA